MDKEKEENEKDFEEMTPEELEAHNKMVDEIAMKVFKKYDKAFRELAKR